MVKSYAAQTAARGSAIFTVDALNMLLMAVLVLLIMRQVMPIAASVAGGAALSSFGLLSRTLAWSTFRAKNRAGWPSITGEIGGADHRPQRGRRAATTSSRAGRAAYRRASETIHELRHGWRRPRP